MPLISVICIVGPSLRNCHTPDSFVSEEILVSTRDYDASKALKSSQHIVYQYNPRGPNRRCRFVIIAVPI